MVLLVQAVNQVLLEQVDKAVQVVEQMEHLVQAEHQQVQEHQEQVALLEHLVYQAVHQEHLLVLLEYQVLQVALEQVANQRLQVQAEHLEIA
jgi:hypothetical protein